MTAKTFTALAFSAAALTAVAANAEPLKVLDGTLSTTATLTTDYVFRGFSQNDENPTPQVNATWAHKSGLHVDGFASLVDIGDADVEVDAGVGYTHKLTDKLTADASIVGYFYPGASTSDKLNYFEGIGTLTYDLGFAKVNGQVAYTPNYAGTGTDDGLFAEASIIAPLTYMGYTVNAVAGLGRQTVDGALDYNTWRAGLTYDYKGFVFGVNYYDTNIGSDQCDDLCSARAVASVAYTF